MLLLRRLFLRSAPRDDAELAGNFGNSLFPADAIHGFMGALSLELTEEKHHLRVGLQVVEISKCGIDLRIRKLGFPFASPRRGKKQTARITEARK